MSYKSEDVTEQVVTKGEILYKRLSTIVERLMQENPVFQEALNPQAIVRMLLDAFNEPSPENAIDLSEAELTKRVRF